MVIVLLLTLAASLAPNGQSADDRVRDAVVAAVRDRVGATADVTVESLTIDGEIEAGDVRAIPEPGARFGGLMQFSLRQAGDARVRRTSASARLRVAVAHAHTTRALERGAEIADGDLIGATHDISTGALRALPSLASASHARIVRPLAAGECLTAPAIAAVPAVRGGRDVTAIARIGDVQASAIVTAAENGDAGAVIRVVNRQTQRALKARVISAGLVEIIHD